MKRIYSLLFIIYYFLFTAGSVITVAEETAATEPPVLKAAETIQLGATNAPAKNVTLGSTDPKSGFKFELELTSRGAAINRAVFSEFDDRDYKNPQPLAILSPVKLPDDREVLSMANKEFVFVQQQLLLPLDKLDWQSFDVQSLQDGSQTARFEATIKAQDSGSPVIKLIKTYKVIPDSFLLDCELTIENLTSTEQKVRFNLTGPVGIGREDQRGDDRKIVGGFITSDGGVVSSRKDIGTSFLSKKLGLKDATDKYLHAQSKEDRERAEEFLRITYKQGGADFLWAATANKYFAAILVPVPDGGRDFCDWVKDKTGWYYNPDGDNRGDSGDETIGVNLEIAPTTLTPKGRADSAKTYNFQLYLGPKDKSLFDKNELYRKLGFFQTIDFMTCCCPANIISPLAFGILAIMKWMYGFIGNYGVVIIILVFLMRLVMHPITKKSQVSMSKMSTLAPKAEEIKKKYANDKAELNKQLMALYKEHGASPMMSMLPMFVQMPIWIALWSAVYTSIDLRGAAFLPFWITDLSAPDALVRFSTVTIPLLDWKFDSLNLLPILMGVAFYLQQKMTPQQAAATSANPQVAQQQKMMMIMMPLLFPLMLYKAPSGVNLYIMASTFAGVIEQYVIKKHIREKKEAESQGLVAVTSKTGGKIKKKKPKPFFRT
jgi:YidC/Oxa1 family membrane protein insertase